MDAQKIRQTFTDFFVDRDHLAVASAPLTAPGDPTLLFTSAGMVPFKPYFLGEAQPPHHRLTSIQKCFRTTDIDEVGDASHLTMFEMLGNFSLGDYFKAEAQAWAWELVTDVIGIPPERLVATVFTDDDYAYDQWKRIGLPDSKIYRYGEDQGNFWAAGPTGPCGPCSELHYDMRPGYREDAGPAEADEKWLEIWNLVFMQWTRFEDGTRADLPAQSIDTGAGLERWAMMLQDQDNLYDTDLFSPLLGYIGVRCDRDYHTANDAERRAMRVVAEHGRAMTFLIADGAIPGNEGRGYVLRRLIRRALYMADSLGIEDDLLSDLAVEVRGVMGAWYPELEEHSALVANVLDQEEHRFRRTLSTGRSLLEGRIAELDSDTITGQDAFELYDTYGLPFEVTAEVAREHDALSDEAAVRAEFELALEQQRERSRQQATFAYDDDAARYAELETATEFSGYETVETEAEVVAIVTGGERVARASAGDAVSVVLDRTSFYPEGGGQVGDAGSLRGTDLQVDVEDTRAFGDVIAHLGKVVSGGIAVGDRVTATVSRGRRADAARNHTATHLLHAALRHVLGDHVRQAGSLVAPDHLRFDYTQPEAPAADDLRAVQQLVQERIRENIPVSTSEMSYDDALKTGAMAIFGEKYETAVRVVEICDPAPHVHDCFSKELCGGTHAPATGFVGAFQIVSEGSVGAGVRRIEALTGSAASAWTDQRLDALSEIATAVRATPDTAGDRIAQLQAEAAELRRRLQAVEAKTGATVAEQIAESATDIGGVAVAVGRVAVESAEALRRAGDEVRRRLSESKRQGVIVLGAVANERPLFVAMATEGAVAAGVNAGRLIGGVARIAGGGGGGSPEMAQAGGRDAEKLDEALESTLDAVREQLG
ncbi:MAG: alanine--tRNA ligase [Chloroflexi bacterium]|nr:alanine--tRNA ligase [Chloroflexota bacterium]MCY3587445.1 alanine--tRNA ligase [Chloroflexota bacterium]MCY3685474.1 alanine--tRNA ligase [Chloroflexota bacterium]MDE2708376.1 alanine--tRNA ligase [Chloroflexota bacterium]